MAMFTFSLQEVELLLDCVTQSRGFRDFEKRGIEELQAAVMELKNDLHELNKSEQGAIMTAWNMKKPEQRKVKKL